MYHNHTWCHMTDIFRTDTEISKSNGGSSNRELKRFTDFADTGDSLDMEVLTMLVTTVYPKY